MSDPYADAASYCLTCNSWPTGKCSKEGHELEDLTGRDREERTTYIWECRDCQKAENDYCILKTEIKTSRGLVNPPELCPWHNMKINWYLSKKVTV